jgi:uncharacterized protein (TIGR03663 family)
MNRGVLLGLLLIVGLALGLRCPFLDQRPMHNDEAVNAIKFGRLWTQGAYKYDPNEHHGPSLYYATLAVARLTSTPDFVHLSEIKLRLITVCFGVGLILLLPLVADGLGKTATLWAGLFTAVSPAMVFYSRYYIHEMLLVFFTFLALACGWRYWRSGKMGWALLAGAGIGVMHATKETFVITLASAVFALGAGWFWNRRLAAAAVPRKAPWKGWQVAAGLLVWLVVATVLFTSFFSNASGIADSVQTYLPWLRRAEGASPHIHPWTFYLHRLLFFHAGKGPVWSEGLILVLALAGAFAGFARKGLADANAGFVRFLAFYTFALTVAYSVISYKTPWCLLSFWDGMILLAGVGAVALFQALKRKWAKAVLSIGLAAGVGHLMWQAWQLDGPYAADQRNPYVYAQTSPDLLDLVEDVEKLANVSPQKSQTVVKVITLDGDYWPLPWYLRNLSQVGWWETLPKDPYAPVMIVSSGADAGLDEKKTHLMGIFALRPGVFLNLYVDADLWQAYLAGNGGRDQ